MRIENQGERVYITYSHLLGRTLPAAGGSFETVTDQTFR